jgi:hypothetical protein
MQHRIVAGDSHPKSLQLPKTPGDRSVFSHQWVWRILRERLRTDYKDATVRCKNGVGRLKIEVGRMMAPPGIGLESPPANPSSVTELASILMHRMEMETPPVSR